MLCRWPLRPACDCSADVDGAAALRAASAPRVNTTPYDAPFLEADRTPADDAIHICHHISLVQTRPLAGSLSMQFAALSNPYRVATVGLLPRLVR